MANVTKMRDVLLAIDGRKVGLCGEVEVTREWEKISYPAYRDSSISKTLRTLENITIRIKKVYQEKEDLYDQLSSTGLSFTLSTGSETHTVTGAQIVDYRLEGGLEGELHELVTLDAESYS